MKKLITSAGLAFLGAASLEAQQVYAPAPGLTTTQTTKPWSVSAAVRGFYDDNYALTPSGGYLVPGNTPGTTVKIKPRDSFGWEVSPSLGLNWKMEQTYIGLSYVYDAKYYEDRPDHKWDQSHQADVKLSHAFTDRYKLDLADSFISTQEPDLVAPVNSPVATIRSREDMIRNYGTLNFTAGLTDQLSLAFGYSNTLYDFSENGPGSLSALLDRMEHLGTVNFRWQYLPSTVFLIGYQFGIYDFTGNEYTGIPYQGANAIGGLTSAQRDNFQHYAYLGVDHTFNPKLDASVRLGGMLTTYYNLPGDEKTEVDPYADANVTYRMTSDSWLQVGVRHAIIATDAAALDQENTTAYASLNYRILPPLTASLLGQYQYNTFQEGQPTVTANYKDKSENFWLVGLNLAYDINRFLAAEVGYNYDHLDSDVAIRSFTRNRVYVGLRASY